MFAVTRRRVDSAVAIVVKIRMIIRMRSMYKGMINHGTDEKGDKCRPHNTFLCDFPFFRIYKPLQILPDCREKFFFALFFCHCFSPIYKGVNDTSI